jgi:hypothetical protein
MNKRTRPQTEEEEKEDQAKRKAKKGKRTLLGWVTVTKSRNPPLIKKPRLEPEPGYTTNEEEKNETEQSGQQVDEAIITQSLSGGTELGIEELLPAELIEHVLQYTDELM